MEKLKFLSKFAAIGALSFLLFSCSQGANSDEEYTYLHVYNWEDYIFLAEEDDELDMTDQFEEFINTEENMEFYGLEKPVKVIYDTFDTPETMYNQMKLGKTKYDIMCPSDYMIQKLAMNVDGLENTNIQKIDLDRVPNYKKYVSPFLIDNLERASITDDGEETLADYAIGYMWGTLGLIYNPESPKLADKYDPEQVIEDFNQPDAWDLLWKNDDYASLASIKDSIRDTYSMAICHVFSDEFRQLKEDFEAGIIDIEDYKNEVNSIFNRCDDETIQKVQDALIELKSRIYGFEVDTGKQDIVSGKISVNLQWSGDAVYSMDEAEEEDLYFYYALPSYAANIWFDGWCIPESCQGQNLAAAYAFLDFLSMPTNAAQNMEYIGYTPFIAGDDVLSVVHDWYDSDDEEDMVEYDLSYFFDGTLESEDSDPIIMTYEEQTLRQLHAQYPTIEETAHLCIMRDFGSQYSKVVLMWENVKVDPIPVWVTIIVVATLVIFLAYLGSYRLIRKAKLKKRKKIRELS